MLNKYGKLGIVIYYRALQHGTMFDRKKLKAIYDSGHDEEITDYFLYETLQATKRSFKIVSGSRESKTKEAFQFLKMLNKILPSDLQKLRRLTLEKIIPKLTEILKPIEARSPQTLNSRTNSLEMSAGKR